MVLQIGPLPVPITCANIAPRALHALFMPRPPDNSSYLNSISIINETGVENRSISDSRRVLMVRFIYDTDTFQVRARVLMVRNTQTQIKIFGTILEKKGGAMVQFVILIIN